MEWTSVNDHLPKDNRLVLVAMEAINATHHNVHLGYFYANSGWELPYYDGVVCVSYWMDIPNPPIDKKS